MSTNRYGTILWQMKIYLVNEKRKRGRMSMTRSTGHGYQEGGRWYGWYSASCWAHTKEISSICWILVSPFSSLLAFVGTDLLKELFSSGSCSSHSFVAGSG